MKSRVFGWVAMVGVLLFTGIAAATAVVPDGWSSPSTVATGDGSFLSTPRLAVTPDGGVVAMWVRGFGPSEVESSMSTDHGVTWSRLQVLSEAGGETHSVRIAAASDGTLVSTWTLGLIGEGVVQSATSIDGGESWSEPVTLSPSRSEIYDLEVFAMADDTFVASWGKSDGIDYVVQLSTSGDGGATWTAPVTVSEPSGRNQSPQVAEAPDGSLVAVWTSGFEPSVVQSSTSRDRGATWSAPVAVSPSSGIASEAKVVISADGVITAVWNQWVDLNLDLVQSSSSRDGAESWSTPVNLSTAGAQQQDVAVGTDGSIVVVWNFRFDSNRFIIQASTSLDSGDTWSAAKDLSSESQEAGWPQIVASPDESFTALWNSSTARTAAEEQEELRTDVLSVTSLDRGVTWSEPLGALGADGRADDAQIAVSSDGALTALWYSQSGESSNIQASFGSAAPKITSDAPPTAKVSTPYFFSFTAVAAPTATFEVTEGTLPEGLELASDGMLTGTPAAEGESSFTVSAVSDGGPNDAVRYTLVTEPAASEATQTPDDAGFELSAWAIGAAAVVLAGLIAGITMWVRTRKRAAGATSGAQVDPADPETPVEASVPSDPTEL